MTYFSKNSLLVMVVIVFGFCVLNSSSAVAAALPVDKVLKQGMSSAEVYLIQQRLKEYDYYHDTVDGIFDAGTRAAVIEFQMSAGLDSDGIVGAKTLQVIVDDRMMASISRSRIDNRTGYQIAAFAKQFIGVPYVWAGRSPQGFDCSGFIYYVFREFGINLPRMADEQFEVGVWVSKQRDLQLGDLVFFETYEPGPSHVGIYIGAGQFIHASSGADEVVITSLEKSYYKARYLGARRLAR
jgi:hypothetical protein